MPPLTADLPIHITDDQNPVAHILDENVEEQLLAIYQLTHGVYHFIWLSSAVSLN